MSYAGPGPEARPMAALARWVWGLGHTTPRRAFRGQSRGSHSAGLVNNPRVILAVEPTGALDTRTGQEVLAIFQQLTARQTVIWSRTSMTLAQHCKRIIRFKDGRVVPTLPFAAPRDALQCSQ